MSSVLTHRIREGAEGWGRGMHYGSCTRCRPSSHERAAAALWAAVSPIVTPLCPCSCSAFPLKSGIQLSLPKARGAAYRSEGLLCKACAAAPRVLYLQVAACTVFTLMSFTDTKVSVWPVHLFNVIPALLLPWERTQASSCGQIHPREEGSLVAAGRLPASSAEQGNLRAVRLLAGQRCASRCCSRALCQLFLECFSLSVLEGFVLPWRSILLPDLLVASHPSSS